MKENFDAFYKLQEFLCLLDLQLSLAQYALKTPNCIRPKFGLDLSLQNANHPVLLKIKDNLSTNGKNDNLVLSNEKSIGNTIRISDTVPFILLTGANMSGKSTFLKQIGNLQVMSQCGSYVPASTAVFSVKKYISSLSGDYSDSANGAKQSSFEQEINEINNIIQSLEDNSLVLIDELCRSTNYYEGLALSIAICEHLLEYLNDSKKNIYILFATHFKELAYLESCYSKIKSYHLESVLDNNQRLCHTFRIEKGVCRLNNYGNWNWKFINSLIYFA